VVGDKTMSARIAIGVGCRLGTSANAIEALVRHALDRTPPAERLGIFTILDKSTEPGLIAAARRLGLDLVFLTREALREQAPFVQTRSIRSATRFGVPSVAEAAALAGAGTGGVLIVPRIVSQGVTCAIAQSPDNPT
jgi:cobalt-precorrin 5A hydrolase